MIFKEEPEDFVVEEIRTLPSLAQGAYVYYLLTKRNITTPEAAAFLSEHLHIPPSHIGYAGNKDKRAVTTQYISFPWNSRKPLQQSYSFTGMSLTYVTHATERITLGDLEGNRFVITIRDLSTQQKLTVDQIRNLFDDQRFGAEQKNIPIGKALVRGRFQEACDLLQLSYTENNYAAALRTVQKKLLRFYVASYQSYLWNLVARQVHHIETVPLVGFLTELTGDVGRLYRALFEHEGITLDNFLFKSLPELMVEGDERPLFVAVKNFSYTYDADELHPTKFKCVLRFELQKGAYATIVVKQLFKD
ncbi:MAG: tRNA pseudouridine(13) synthase TruD [Nanoarchaeota archaeon]